MLEVKSTTTGLLIPRLTQAQGSDKPVSALVMDITGKIVEKRNNVLVNSSLTIGRNYRPHIYLIEVLQGKERKTLKLIKQSN